ncbi:MAG TPA: cupin domain-containing protein [Rhizomicrobium sp.]|jgi:mannose-6-phosphate isomerase-like protein (cupin superfamily)|nr:cupin domain-containing protein [Rhizomicrobium sp.]
MDKMDEAQEKQADLFRAFFENYRWESVPFLPYKEEGSAPFKSITRQVLFHDPELRCELRYFEVAPGGYSTLERHQHTHGVMILRGEADVLVGSEIRPVRTFDLVRIPPMTWHQFRTKGETPMGFLCMVNVERDRPQLPGEDDLRQLKSDPAIAAFLSR